MKPLPTASWQLLGYKPNKWALKEVHSCEARFAAYCTCRQCGKTEALSMELHDALTKGRDPQFGPPLVGVLSFDFEHVRISVDRYMERLKRAGIPFHANMNEHWLKLENGAMLRWLSADDPFSVAGYTWSDFYIDEAQKVSDDVWHKLRPGLDVRRASLRAFGTPDVIPEQTWFEGLFLRGQDPLEKNYHSFTLPAAKNRWMTLETIQEAYETLTEREFRMLYLGQWVDAEGRVFRVNDDQFNSTLIEKPDSKGIYVMGLDVGTAHDYTVAYVGDSSKAKFVHGMRFNGLDYPVIEERIVSLYKRFHCRSILMEANGPGKPVADALRAAGCVVEDIHISGKQKAEVIQNLARVIEHNSVGFLKGDNQLKRELRAYSRKITPAGNVIYTAPTNFFDDTVIAAAFTAYKMRNPGAIRVASYANFD